MADWQEDPSLAILVRLTKHLYPGLDGTRASNSFVNSSLIHAIRNERRNGRAGYF